MTSMVSFPVCVHLTGESYMQLLKKILHSEILSSFIHKDPVLNSCSIPLLFLEDIHVRRQDWTYNLP